MPPEDEFFAARQKMLERCKRLLRDPYFRERVQEIAQAGLNGVREFVESEPEGRVDPRIIEALRKFHSEN